MSEIHKYNYIDALRGYAILGVVCVHSLMGDKGILLANVIGLGAKGVPLFYIVSTFTLFLSFMNRKDEKKPIINYFIRRFFRIAPMFYLAIIYYSIQEYLMGDFTTITFMAIISHYTFLHGLSPYWENNLVPGGWSVAVEVMFYLFCPFLFKKVSTIKIALFMYLFTFVIAQLLCIYFKANPLISDNALWDTYLYTYFPTQLPVFILGIVAFFGTKLKIFDAFKLIITLLIFYLILFTIQRIFNVYKYQVELTMLNNMIASITFVAVIIFSSKYILYGFTNPFIRFLGKISYSMYLSHFAVIYWLEASDFSHILKNINANYWLRLSIILFFSTSIALLFYKIIEMPCITFGKKIINKMEVAT